MASPWIPAPQRPQTERPWIGLGLLVAVPVFSLILIRMLWSGSSLWFLMLGIILLGAAAVVFLARRPQELEYDRQMQIHETHRAPLILSAIGILFLAMLLLPNFSGGGSDGDAVAQQQPPTGDLANDVAGVTDAQPGVSQQPSTADEQLPADDTISGEDETYVVESGDTLWGIAQRFTTTVDAIVEANDLESAGDLQVGQELVIPGPPEEVTQ